MAGPLAGRVALVTGAGQGIGAAIAHALAADGACVAVNDRRRDTAETVASQIADSGGVAHAVVADIVDFESSRRLVQEVSQRLGPVDILVCNASNPTSGRSLLRTPLAEVDDHFRVNALASLALCQEVLPSMRAGGRGDIVLLTSIAVQHMPPRSGPYNMAKAALEALAYTLAKEEARHGIRVNLVAPGLTDTPSGRLVRDRLIQATGGTVAADDPAWHLKPPSAIADAVRFFVSPAAEFVTGQRLTVGA